MERLDFLRREAINTPEMELKIRAVFSENTALHEENAALKDEVSVLKERLAWFEKQVCGQKSEKTEVILENSEAGMGADASGTDRIQRHSCR